MPEPAELLMREVALELGQTVEGGLALAMDRAQDALVEARKRFAARGGRDIQSVVEPVITRMSTASYIVPFVGGRIAAASSYLVMRSGLRLMRRARSSFEKRS